MKDSETVRAAAGVVKKWAERNIKRLMKSKKLTEEAVTRLAVIGALSPAVQLFEELAEEMESEEKS